ncbi:hypothetical protein EBU94_07680, partial [bacterium]|nr:hypothetical protein [bacterium]
MKKFLVSESEKKQILNQHSDYKKILKKLSVKKTISEQIEAPTGDELLTKAIKVCSGLSGGKIGKLRGGNNAIKVIASKDGPQAQTGQPKYVVGDILAYKSDMTYDVYDKNNKSKKGSYRWKCANLNKEADADKERRMKEFKNTHDGGGWMTYEEAAQSGKIITTDPNTFETVPYEGITLYRPKASGGKKAFTPKQQEYVDRMKNEGWVEEGDPVLTGPNKHEWHSAIAPGSQDVFPPNGITMYKSKQDVVKGSENIIQRAKQSNKSRSFDRGNCKDFIEQYWEAFKIDGSEANQKPNEDLKIAAQGCIRQYYKNWGGMFS